MVLQNKLAKNSTQERVLKERVKRPDRRICHLAKNSTQERVLKGVDHRASEWNGRLELISTQIRVLKVRDRWHHLYNFTYASKEPDPDKGTESLWSLYTSLSPYNSGKEYDPGKGTERCSSQD